MNKERIKECKCVKEIYDALKKRYSKKRLFVGRQYLHKLVTYRMPKDGNIQDS
jgi:hypothetical protein